MRAVVLPEAGRFDVRTNVPVPVTAPGLALLRVHATTICATDQKIVAGEFPGTRFPHIPGHEFAGEVAAVHPGVDEVTIGDRVGVEVHVGCGSCLRCLEGLNQLCENYGRLDKGHAHIGFTVPGGWLSTSPCQSRRCIACPTRCRGTRVRLPTMSASLCTQSS